MVCEGHWQVQLCHSLKPNVSFPGAGLTAGLTDYTLSVRHPSWEAEVFIAASLSLSFAVPQTQLLVK